MKINDLKIYKKAINLSLVSALSLSTLTGCNKQIFDFNKSFNIAIEKNGENLSVVGIKGYSDYNGTQIQFVTEDNLRVVTSTFQTQLINSLEESDVNNYIKALADEENIIRYDDLQGTKIDYSLDNWNKDIFDFHYTYNKAIILSDDKATIVPLYTWKDYEDDKIQLQLEDGTFILTNADKIKLINDEDAGENSLKNYAITLVGSEENIKFYDKEKIKQY